MGAINQTNWYIKHIKWICVLTRYCCHAVHSKKEERFIENINEEIKIFFCNVWHLYISAYIFRDSLKPFEIIIFFYTPSIAFLMAQKESVY